MKYYFLSNGQQQGPFEPHELAINGCTPNSKVWREGLDKWTVANELPELAVVLAPPQPVQMPQQQVQMPQMPQMPQQQVTYAQQPAAPWGMPRKNQEIMPVVETLKEGITLGIKNVASLIVAVILYVLTIWIPYLNVGTTIALLNIPIELGRGKVINPTFIFNSVYRKNLGQFFIYLALVFAGMIPALLFLVGPAIVLSFSWYIAIYLMFDKEINAMEALHKSTQFTYGYKLKMFFIKLIFNIPFLLIIGIVYMMLRAINPSAEIGWMVTIFLSIIWLIAYLTASLGVDAVIYRELLKRTDVEV